MRRRFRHLAGATLLILGGLILAPAPARAQEEPPAAEEEGGGNMYYGYVGTGVLAAAILFAVCRTSRR